MSEVAVVFPTVAGREDSLERAIDSFPDDCTAIVVRNAPACGQAWVEGAREAWTMGADYVCLAADDHEAHPGYVDTMVETIDQGFHPAALVLNPNGSRQSCGGAAFDVCRRGCEDWARVEWSPTPFLSRQQWELVEPHADTLAELHYSSDMLVSRCLKDFPCVVRTVAVLTHHNHQVGRGAGMGQYERCARDQPIYRAWAAA